jgi:hypothetical protein
VGRGHARQFTTYHRVLNRAGWSPLPLSRTLLRLIVAAFVPADGPRVLVIDDPLERRYGRRVPYTARAHDAVRSAPGHTVTSSGSRWRCVCALVPVPWSTRPWALPFLTVPCPTPAASRKLGKQRQRPLPERAQGVVRLIRRWQLGRAIVLIGDSGSGVVSLAETCRTRDVTLVARLRLTAALYGPVPPQPRGKPGVKPTKGPRLPSPGAILQDPATAWAPLEVRWYGGEAQAFDLVSDTALWHRDGEPPVPIRWVVLRDPSGTLKPTVLGCTDQHATPLEIVTWDVGRWNSEVTLQESRGRLGGETQRPWTRRAIARTTPCLLGLCSLVTLLAHALHGSALPTRQSAWYAKGAVTFADALAAVRRHLWTSRVGNTPAPPHAPQMVDSPASLLTSLVEAACYAA